MMQFVGIASKLKLTRGKGKKEESLFARASKFCLHHLCVVVVIIKLISLLCLPVLRVNLTSSSSCKTNSNQTSMLLPLFFTDKNTNTNVNKTKV